MAEKCWLFRLMRGTSCMPPVVNILNSLIQRLTRYSNLTAVQRKNSSGIYRCVYPLIKSSRGSLRTHAGVRRSRSKHLLEIFSLKERAGAFPFPSSHLLAPLIDITRARKAPSCLPLPRSFSLPYRETENSPAFDVRRCKEERKARSRGL